MFLRIFSPIFLPFFLFISIFACFFPYSSHTSLYVSVFSSLLRPFIFPIFPSSPFASRVLAPFRLSTSPLPPPYFADPFRLFLSPSSSFSSPSYLSFAIPRLASAFYIFLFLFHFPVSLIHFSSSLPPVCLLFTIYFIIVFLSFLYLPSLPLFLLVKGEAGMGSEGQKERKEGKGRQGM